MNSKQTNTGKTHFKKGNVPWNKGKYGLIKQSEDSNIQRSETLKKTHKEKKWGFASEDFIPWNKDMKGFRKGIPRHSYNNKFREKISKSKLGATPWNKNLTKENDLRLKKISISMTHDNPMKKMEVKRKVSMNAQGVTEIDWKGFISYGEYGEDFNKRFKELIKKRDNYTCVCGKTNCKLIVHHIDYNKQNNQDNNCISLCSNCHAKTNWNRYYWQSFLNAYLLNKYKGGTKWEIVQANLVTQ